MSSLRKIKAHLNAAKSYAELSYAKRLKVGAVIAKDDRIISVGYNGTPSGRDNECEYNIPIYENSFKLVGHKLETIPEVVHAEMNAIAFASKLGVSTDGAALIITHSPCFNCSKLIVQAGIKELYYETEYRDVGALIFLASCGIKIRRIE